MKLRPLLAGATGVALSLVLSEGQAGAFEGPTWTHRWGQESFRDVNVAGHQCRLHPSLFHEVYEIDSQPEEFVGGTSRAYGADNLDRQCAANVTVTLYYSAHGQDYILTGKRTADASGDTLAVVSNSIYRDTTGAPEATGLRSTHRYYFPACDCVFTDTISEPASK